MRECMDKGKEIVSEGMPAEGQSRTWQIRCGMARTLGVGVGGGVDPWGKSTGSWGEVEGQGQGGGGERGERARAG
jgi:hypothetical protein